MSHTFTNLHFHFVFRTKDSLELITNEIKPELYAYLGGLTKELKGKPLAINGMSEHIHLLVSLPPTVSISDALKFLKANSSKWMSERFGKEFAWQIGYGAFSVSRSNVNAVVKYIQNQEEHHQKYDFKEEFLKLLRSHEVEFDENYLWK
ncbi:MAG: IS200/IS605 family transposase [Pyrinomonadaceae bacterium]|nr:IS200/IS605 family transposase [Pyrinomonadaceae bacterium]